MLGSEYDVLKSLSEVQMEESRRQLNIWVCSLGRYLGWRGGHPQLSFFMFYISTHGL